MPIRSRGTESKSTCNDSTASTANRLSKSSRPKRGPGRADPRSASVTLLAAVITRSFMAENERAVHTAESSVEFQDAIEPGRGARFAQEAGRRTFRRDVQPG